MIGNPQRNGQAIKRGLKWLRERTDVTIERGMRELLPYSMGVAIADHDNVHFGHRTTSNSYGVALLHYGEVVFLETNTNGHHGHGNADEILRSQASNYSEYEWIGLVLADMTAERDESRKNRTIFFDEEYELEVLQFTKEDIKYRYPNFFKRWPDMTSRR